MNFYSTTKKSTQVPWPWSLRLQKLISSCVDSLSKLSFRSILKRKNIEQPDRLFLFRDKTLWSSQRILETVPPNISSFGRRMAWPWSAEISGVKILLHRQVGDPDDDTGDDQDADDHHEDQRPGPWRRNAVFVGALNAEYWSHSDLVQPDGLYDALSLHLWWNRMPILKVFGMKTDFSGLNARFYWNFDEP